MASTAWPALPRMSPESARSVSVRSKLMQSWQLSAVSGAGCAVRPSGAGGGTASARLAASSTAGPTRAVLALAVVTCADMSCDGSCAGSAAVEPLGALAPSMTLSTRRCSAASQTEKAGTSKGIADASRGTAAFAGV